MIEVQGNESVLRNWTPGAGIRRREGQEIRVPGPRV
jgi:hypothetical protein